ncbi:hypothetical protein G210_3208 [Candida maltosa Xu316]|uniref:Uncharacterized protein n=1 Tax=Candida maltosa (strain Xu316) TaxID=1245528 RepID=M3IJI7_CANMX|nr:hypothetical protein G210_3208 [Candida maltosa Xu316]
MSKTIDDTFTLSSSSSESDDDSNDNVLTLLTGKRPQKNNNLPKPPPKRQTPSRVSTTKPTKNIDPFDIELPAVFQTSDHFHHLNTQYETMKSIIDKDERDLKRQYDKLQQHKARLIMELNDNGSYGRKRYDISEDSEIVDGLIKRDINGVGILRHFYFLSDVGDDFYLGDFEKVPLSLIFLIQRDIKVGYKKIEGDVKGFVMRVLDTTLNPMFLKSVNEMLLSEHESAVFDMSEVIELVEKCGGNTKIMGGDDRMKLPLKIDQFNNQLTLQLLRITVILNCYLSGDDIDWDRFVKLFILIISDHNANQRDYETLCYLIKTVLTKIKKKFNNEEFTKNVYAHISQLSTYNYGEENKESKKGDYQIKLGLLQLLNITDGIENTKIELEENLENIYEFSLQIKLLTMHYSPIIETNINSLKKIKDKVSNLKKNVYQSMQKLSSINCTIDNVDLTREELIMIITDDYQQLEYLNNLLQKKYDFLESDFFYNDV